MYSTIMSSHIQNLHSYTVVDIWFSDDCAKLSDVSNYSKKACLIVQSSSKQLRQKEKSNNLNQISIQLFKIKTVNFFYRFETTFTTRKTRMDSKPMAANMMPLYKTASFLVHANMSIDRGVDILQGNKFTWTWAD